MVNTTAHQPVSIDFLQQIVGVSWGSKRKGLLYMDYTYTAQNDGSAPGPLPAIMGGLPYGGAFNVLDDVRYGPYVGPIVQPVSDDMLASLLQWTPDALYDSTTSSTPVGQNVYYVTTGGAINASNFNDDAHATDLCGTPLAIIGLYGGTFFNCNYTARAVLAANGFDLSQMPDTTDGHFRTAAQAAYYSLAFNTYSSIVHFGATTTTGFFLDPAPQPTYTRVARSNFILNLDAIAKQLPVGATGLTFHIDIPSTPPASWKLEGGVFQTRKTFPVDAKNNAQFTGLTASTTGASAATTVTVTVNFAAHTVAFSSGGGGAS